MCSRGAAFATTRSQTGSCTTASPSLYVNRDLRAACASTRWIRPPVPAFQSFATSAEHTPRGAEGLLDFGVGCDCVALKLGRAEWLGNEPPGRAGERGRMHTFEQGHG